MFFLSDREARALILFSSLLTIGGRRLGLVTPARLEELTLLYLGPDTWLLPWLRLTGSAPRFFKLSLITFSLISAVFSNRLILMLRRYMSVSFDFTYSLTLLIISLSTCISASTSSLCFDAFSSFDFMSIACCFFSFTICCLRSSHLSTVSRLSFFSCSI